MKALSGSFGLSAFLASLVWTSAAAQAIEVRDLAPIDCPAGQEAETWALRELGSPVPVEALKRVLPEATGSQKVSASTNVRLDFCVDSEDRVSLKRIVQVMQSYNSRQVYDESNADFLVAEGLIEARMGDYAKLRIVVKNRENNQGTVILGSNDGPDPFIAYSPGAVVSATRWDLDSTWPWVGSLDSYDPFANNPCKDGRWLVRGVSKFATVTLEYEICTFLGGGQTTGYEIVGLKVTDQEANRPAAFRGVPIVFERSELIYDRQSRPTDPFTEEQKTRRLTFYRYLHHNACDSIYIQVPELKAAYALTSAPMGGCGNPVMGGVMQDFSDDSPMKTRVRIDYDGRAGQPFYAEFLRYFQLIQE